MKDFYPILKENKKEAIDLLKKAGGQINFEDNFKEGVKVEVNDNDPIVIFGDSALIDGVALAARIGKEPDTIEFYGYDCECNTPLDWFDTESCHQFTENQIYLAIDGWCEEHGIRLD